MPPESMQPRGQSILRGASPHAFPRSITVWVSSPNPGSAWRRGLRVVGIA